MRTYEDYTGSDNERDTKFPDEDAAYKAGHEDGKNEAFREVASLRERLEAAERERDNAQEQLELRNRAFCAWFAVAMKRDADLRGKLERARGALEYQHNGKRKVWSRT